MPSNIPGIVLGVVFGTGVIGYAVYAQFDERFRAQAEEKRVASLTPEQRAAEERDRAAQAEKKARADRLDSARFACQQFVEKTLHDPKSAEFEYFGTYPAEEKNGVYDVQVRLRAKNGFNALRSTAVVCRTRQVVSGDWISVSLQEVR